MIAEGLSLPAGSLQINLMHTSARKERYVEQSI